MPNLPTHLNLALKVAAGLAHPTIDRYLGTFLLGSTSPDIRIMTKWKRDRTHFAPLTIDRVGTGAEGIFRAYPALADSSMMGAETSVFVSGYFTHLVADEAWILDIYRPHFDGQGLFSDKVQANIWDRALQLDMDKTAREELGDMAQVREFLNGAGSEVDVGFISRETLGDWREWVTEFTTWEFSWDRLRFLTRRMYGDDDDALRRVEDFLECVPESLKRVYDEIPIEKIRAYQERVIGESVSLVKEYLGEPESD